MSRLYFVFRVMLSSNIYGSYNYGHRKETFNCLVIILSEICLTIYLRREVHANLLRFFCLLVHDLSSKT